MRINDLHKVFKLYLFQLDKQAVLNTRDDSVTELCQKAEKLIN